MPARLIAATVALSFLLPTVCDSQITGAHRRELREITSQLGQAAAAIRDEDSATAKTLVEEAETRLTAVQEQSGLDADAAVFRSVRRLIDARKEALGQSPSPGSSSGSSSDVGAKMASEGTTAGAVSFTDTVAPLLSAKCIRCHSDRRSSGGLNLATFANMKAGGDSGALVVRGNPEESPLFYRCAEDDPETRMPKGGQLQDDELAALKTWIADGAAFDGSSETAALGRLTKAGMEKKEVEAVIPMSTGDETVSFTKDIGPMFNRICLQCHSGNNPSGGLSLTTFRNIMEGGDSGAVIVPGDRENSRLFRLVGGLELPRMPANNQLRIRRSEYDALVKWFEEGNTFDGPDPDALITSYIETEERKAAMARQSRSAEDWHKARKESTAALWNRGMRLIDPEFAETEDVFAAGNAENLSELAEVAQGQVDELNKTFGGEGLKKYGVSLLAINTSYGHKELGRALSDRTPGTKDTAHGYADPTLETLYAAVDTSSPSDETLSVEDRVRVAVTAAYLSSLGNEVPVWLSEGVARAMVQSAPKAPAMASWVARGRQAILDMEEKDVLNDTMYRDDELASAGAVIGGVLISAGGTRGLNELVKQLAGGKDAVEALQAAYRASPVDIGGRVQAAVR